MNNTVKIYLNIELQGSTLTRKREAEEINYVLTNKDIQPNKQWRGKDGIKVVKKGSFKHYPYEIKSATLHINMSYDAYNYMCSSECPAWASQKDWKRMSKAKRIEAHMQRTCDHFGGKSFNYEVLDD